ncbi:MAG: hypothetical protein KDD11_14760 [Acidobacteria bacterium]|nr:hypothetical protein [Acidobacteriota bacterium]
MGVLVEDLPPPQGSSAFPGMARERLLRDVAAKFLHPGSVGPTVQLAPNGKRRELEHLVDLEVTSFE